MIQITLPPAMLTSQSSLTSTQADRARVSAEIASCRKEKAVTEGARELYKKMYSHHSVPACCRVELPDFVYGGLMHIRSTQHLRVM